MKHSLLILIEICTLLTIIGLQSELLKSGNSVCGWSNNIIPVNSQIDERFNQPHAKAYIQYTGFIPGNL